MKHSKIGGLIGSKRFALEELSERFFVFSLVFAEMLKQCNLNNAYPF